MSFGYRDSDWIDPPEPDWLDDYYYQCGACERYVPCMCDCGYGFCSEAKESVSYNDKLYDCDWRIIIK